MHSVVAGERGAALVLPHEVDTGHHTPGRGGYRTGRKPGILPCHGKKEARDCVPSREVGGWRLCPVAARMSADDCVPTREGRRRSCSLTRLTPVIVLPSLSPWTAPTADRPPRAAACKDLCVRGGGPAANFFVFKHSRQKSWARYPATHFTVGHTWTPPLPTAAWVGLQL